MDTSRLSKDQKVKSYKEMCELLNEKVKTGNAKIAQLNEWERYFTYEREKFSFIIKEVYQEPLPKTETISHVQIIEILLLDMLATHDQQELLISKTKLLKRMKIINDIYNFIKKNQNKSSQYLNVNVLSMNDFFASTDRTLKYQVEKAFNNLKNKYIINWSKEVILCHAETSVKTNDNNEVIATIEENVDEWGDSQYSVTSENLVSCTYRLATKQEADYIVAVKHTVKENMGLNMDIAFVPEDKRIEFNNKVNTLLREKMNIVYYYQSYRFGYNSKHIEKAINRLSPDKINSIERAIEEINCEFLLEPKEKHMKMSLLNIESQDYIVQLAEKRHKSALCKKESGASMFNINNRTKETYITDTRKIVSTTFDFNDDSKVTIEKIKKYKGN
ncbi:hypothetical protein EBB07_29425 [Paenibacillaceae bacterium]|nr:hypothetical protein EBB07_29425 [Paenibacillaceae bacterium]